MSKNRTIAADKKLREWNSNEEGAFQKCVYGREVMKCDLSLGSWRLLKRNPGAHSASKACASRAIFLRAPFTHLSISELNRVLTRQSLLVLSLCY